MPLSFDNLSAAQNDPAVYAIIPAAGSSRRMTASKQLMPIGGRPMLQIVIDTLTASSANEVMVVTRREITSALKLTENDKLRVVENNDASSEMIDSIRIGLRAWRERGVIHANDGFLICPGDLPLLTAPDVNACVDAFKNSPHSLVIACHAGRRGHPMIFPASYATFVDSSACDAGLSALPRQFTDRIHLVERPTPSVLRDVDTPGDLRHL